MNNILRISYSVLLNYLQCPFRSLLLWQLQPKTALFEPQFIGLYAHEYVERYLQTAINGEQPSMEYMAVVQDILNQDREIAFDLEKAKEKIDALPMQQWAETVYQFLAEKGCHTVETEQKIVVKYEGKTTDFEISGIADVVAHLPNETIIIDLKRSDWMKHYDDKQLTIYSYVFGKYKVKNTYLLFMKKDGTVEPVHYEIKENSKLLHWMLSEMEKVVFCLENDLQEYFPPHTWHRTCHPNRCSVWHLCPHGQQTNIEDWRLNEDEGHFYNEEVQFLSLSGDTD